VPKKNSLYIVPAVTNSSTAERTTMALTSMTPIQLHHCLGHIHGPAATRLIKENIIEGIEVITGEELSFCEACTKAKHVHESFLKV
jgi:hypothetical protein